MTSVLICVLLLGTTLHAAAPLQRGKAAGASDAVVEQNIRARFAKSKIAEDKFTVRVQGGRAVIEGTTNVIQRKGVATRLAKAGGAAAVDNRIRIGEQARQKAAEALREHRPRPSVRPTERTSQRPSERPAVRPVVVQPEPEPKAIPRAQVKH
jgi:hypothetical protein